MILNFCMLYHLNIFFFYIKENQSKIHLFKILKAYHKKLQQTAMSQTNSNK